jgi:hypothetical protein
MSPASIIEAPNPSIFWYSTATLISNLLPPAGFASLNCVSGFARNRSPAFEDTQIFAVCAFVVAHGMHKAAATSTRRHQLRLRIVTESPSIQKLPIESNQYCMQTRMSRKFLGDSHFHPAANRVWLQELLIPAEENQHGRIGADGW